MVKSMTAYGRSSKVSTLGEWQVEVHSVNKKSLELSVFLPKELLSFDVAIRKKVAPFCGRGHVVVKVSFTINPVELFSAEEVAFLKSWKEQLQAASIGIGCDPKEITFPFLWENMRGQGFIWQKRKEQIEDELFSCLEEALQEYQHRKEVEGETLQAALLGYLQTVYHLAQTLQDKAPEISRKRKQKLIQRLQELGAVLGNEEERVLKEVFYYTERADISEELIRLFSHIQQSRCIIQERGSIGRSLDFLVQEMTREVNTISSKSDDLEVTGVALMLKMEIEKIREQVQNIV